MKTTHLKARYNLDELKKWAESGEASQAMKDIAEELKKKSLEHHLFQCSARSPRPFRQRGWRPRRSGRISIDPQLLDISHHLY